MRTIFYILRKEFRQILRNKSMLPIIFLMPVIQLLVLANAATFEIQNVRFNVLDLDRSTFSTDLINKFESSEFFTRSEGDILPNDPEEEFMTDNSDMIIIIPAKFEKDIISEGSSNVQVLINAINGSAAGIISAYTQKIISDYNNEKITQNGQVLPMLDITYRHWYNPELDYITFMVPGIMVLLVTMIGIFLSGMSIVKEKEIGTIEQLNVTPIRKYEFILGKLIPFFVIGMFELAFGLAIGKFVFNVPFVGSTGLIFLFAGVYLIVVLSMGLIISTYTDTQQQAMFITWFIMVLFLLMSGLFTPIESMPMWAQRITLLNPVAYFIKVMRMIMLKGSGFQETARSLYILLCYGLVSTMIAVLRYKKVN